MTTYTTQSGDMWDLIAYRQTGNLDQLEAIMKANPEHAKTYIFPAGVKLKIPEPVSVNVSLPPWKR